MLTYEERPIWQRQQWGTLNYNESRIIAVDNGPSEAVRLWDRGKWSRKKPQRPKQRRDTKW